MQKVFDAMPNDMGIKAEMILEINEKHPITKKLKDLYENDKEEFDKYTQILYSEARMIAGLPIDNPTEISRLICEVISKQKVSLLTFYFYVIVIKGGMCGRVKKFFVSNIYYGY